MPVDAVDECQGVHGILTICDGGNDFPECESQSSSEVSSPKRPWTVFDDPSICQNITYVKVDVINNDTLCFPDLDVGKEKWDTSKPGDETIQTMTSEHSLTLFRRALQKKISLQVGEKFMQFLMDSSLELPKFISSDYSKEVYDLSTAVPEFCKNVCPIYHVSVSFDKCMKERVFDTPTSRSRKYNRSVSFNSRRVGLLFSVLPDATALTHRIRDDNHIKQQLYVVIKIGSTEKKTWVQSLYREMAMWPPPRPHC